MWNHIIVEWIDLVYQYSKAMAEFLQHIELINLMLTSTRTLYVHKI